MIDQAKELIKKHEGLELKPYRCTADKLTIGYGRNIEDVGISQDEAEYLLETDISRCVQDLASFSWWHNLDETRQAVLIDLRYNLGPSRFRGFRNMLAALEVGDYGRAADEMLDSRWARQVGRRADTLSELMRVGAWAS